MIEKISDLLVGKESEDDLRRYAKLVSLFGIAQVANSVRIGVMIPKDNKSIPVNMYGILLAPSGVGKTRSNNFVSDLIAESMQLVKDKSNEALEVLDPFGLEEIGDLTSEGVTVANSYKSLTDAATIKLMRVLDLIGYFGINYVVDEFASVVSKEYEMLSSTVLELYDKGVAPVNLRATSKVKKAETPIPMNMLAFGSAHLLFEGDIGTEKAFFDLAQAGLGRRNLFCNVQTQINSFSLDANKHRVEINALVRDFSRIISEYDKFIFKLSDEAEELYTSYMNLNTDESIQHSVHKPLHKIYAKNKYWIALKISGLIAVSRFHNEVTIDDYQYAVDMVNDSEMDFQSIIDRPQKYEIVVDYLLEENKEESEYTLTQKLPFYKEIKNKKQFLELCRGYSFENNITFMTQDRHNVTFYSAKGREKVDLEKPLLFSYSLDITKDYYPNDDIYWKDFHNIVCNDKGVCYSAHTFKDGYRKKDNAIEGFTLVILDFDGGVSIDMAKMLFKDYTYLIATTKSHMIEKHGVIDERFRLILPMSNKLELDAEQYSKFYKNLLEDLPIEADSACSDPSRFYYSASGEHWYNEGELFDATQYIPDTQEADTYQKQGNALAKKNINGIGQYILRNETSGRNNQLNKYSLLLLDKGYTKDETKTEVLRLNKQFGNPLAESEVKRTIFKTIDRRPDVEVEDDDDDYEIEEDDPFNSIDSM